MPSFHYSRDTRPFLRVAFGLVYLVPRKHSAVPIQTVGIHTGNAKNRGRLRFYRHRKDHGSVPVLVWSHGFRPGSWRNRRSVPR